MQFVGTPWRHKDQIEKNGPNADYWATETRAWMEDNNSIEDWSVTAIAGTVVINLGDEWQEHHAKDLIKALYDAQIPVYKREGSERIRIEGSSRRLNVSYQ